VARAQALDDPGAWRVGLGSGRATQQAFPLNDRDYRYQATGYKLFFNRPLLEGGAFGLELQLGPSIHAARHRLVNPYYVQPKEGPDYLAQRARFTQERAIREYALNVGVLMRFRLTEPLSVFVLGSTGPMVIDTPTERLARGFAFSDVIACGVGIRARRLLVEVGPVLRHASNANTHRPNSGLNSVGIDVGVSYSP
jgi:hypothetical protein